MNRPHSSYGWAAKVGLIVPPTNTVNEAEWQLMLRETRGVSMHVARMALHLDAESDAGRQALERDLRGAIDSLRAGAMDVIAYGCTAGSMVSPLDALNGFMQRRSGVPCATTASVSAGAWAGGGEHPGTRHRRGRAA
jgi:maleate cis-trans isomerase